MPDHTYKVIDLVGTSPDGVDQAIRNAIERANQTLRGLDWFQVTEIRGHIQDGTIGHFQVGLKVGFQIMDDEGLQSS
jgi:flavin-binding protein dodecin